MNQSLIQHEPNQSILTKQSIQLDTHKLIHRLQSIQDLVESKESLIKQSNKSILTLIDTYYFKDKERNEQLIEKNSETRKRIQRLDALSKEVSVRHLASIDQIHLNTQTIQHSIIQYQRKAIQELIKIFRLRKYKKNDKTEEYRIASTGFQITNLKGFLFFLFLSF